jgi:hypothetical protein
MGNFALTAAELAEAAPRMRKAHSMNPAERADAVHRMNTWLEIGSAYQFNTAQVLEALPAVISSALAARTGLVSVTAAM